MLHADASAADLDPVEPGSGDAAAPPAAAQDTEGTERQGARRRYGRQRGGTVPVGEAFVLRLGPANGEPFAALDDEGDEWSNQRPSHDAPVEALRFVALDSETTGQTPHRLVELGAVAFTLDHHLLSFETLVHSNDRINPHARRLHGISHSVLAGAPPADDVLERFRGFAEGAVLVEHSADAFDTRLLGRTMGRPLDADNIDTSRLAGKLWGLRDTIGLERLCAELGVSHRRPHHALADAEATAACFIALLQRGREQFGWNTLGDLLRDGQPPPPRFPTSRPPDRRRRGPGQRGPAPAEGDAESGAAAVDAEAGAVASAVDGVEAGGDGAAAAAPRSGRRRRRGGRRRRRAPGADGQPPGPAPEGHAGD
ncbi:MAG TPA: 3'-5' exonuclease [Candidatus Dormibacteraeota bacterium]|jgi:DNA polymerase III epsilon subunit-like protein|nr:3'-5' exonuclease [Candidatus Dormibacteraeota bacterium]